MTINIGQLVSTTIANYPDAFADAASNNVVLYKVLKDLGKIQEKQGGTQVIEPIIYNATSNYQRVVGMGRVDLAQRNQVDAYVFDWKKAMVSLVIDGSEKRKNSTNDEQMIDFVEAKMEATTADLVNGFDADLYSDGTASGGNQLIGLAGHLPDNPALGTIGGVSRVSFIPARSQVQSGTTVSASNIRPLLSALINKCSRNTDVPDIAFTDNNYFGFMQSALQAIERINDGNSSFGKPGNKARSLYHDGVKIYLAGGYAGSAPTSKLYLLDTKSWKIKFLKGAALEVLGEKDGLREPIDQDGYAKLIGFEGAFTCNNYFTNGVLKD